MPFTYKKFQRIMQRMNPAPTPVPAITKSTVGNAKTPQVPEQDDVYGVPTLSHLGKHSC